MENTTKYGQKVADFFSAYPSHNLPSGQDIILAGNEPAGVYYLESGYIRQYDINGRNGLEFTAHTFVPGSILPLTWALSDLPNNYFYTTMGETTVFVAPKEHLQHFLHKNPDVLFDICKRLLSGIEGLTTRVKYLALGDAHQRVIIELVYLSRHLGVRQGKTVTIKHNFTHQNIANLTGMARETVSHIIEQLHKEGVLTDTRHRITIHDIDAFNQLAKL